MIKWVVHKADCGYNKDAVLIRLRRYYDIRRMDNFKVKGVKSWKELVLKNEDQEVVLI